MRRRMVAAPLEAPAPTSAAASGAFSLTEVRLSLGCAPCMHKRHHVSALWLLRRDQVLAFTSSTSIHVC
jgi:hypothetical protein